MLTFGLASCVLVAWLASRMEMVDKTESVPLILARMIGYLPWLTVEIIKSNIDVAKRVWHPDLPISPTIVTVKASQKTALGLVLHANSITLTPGTLSIDVEDGEIEVHSLAEELVAAFDDGEMDRRVTRLEGGQ
jgi:multicomponent Na+:H+ antiporter subunit E